MSYSTYMSDCVHLKACRRLSLIAKNTLVSFNRGCNKDCTAYVSGDDERYISIDDAVYYARSGESMVRGGWDAYDVYVSSDLAGATLNELVNGDGDA